MLMAKAIKTCMFVVDHYNDIPYEKDYHHNPKADHNKPHL